MANSFSKGFGPTMRTGNKTISIGSHPHNLYVSFNSASIYYGLRLTMAYLNPQYRDAEMKLTPRLLGVEIVLMGPFSWQGQDLC